MKTQRSLLTFITLLAITPLVQVAAKDRVTLNQFGGFEGGDPRKPVEVSKPTRVKSITFISGDRINGIILRGADGSAATFKGGKWAKEQAPIVLAEGECLVGFQGLCSDGRDMGPIPMRGGWFKARAVIDGPKGRRYSETFGTGGPSDMKIAGPLRVSIGVKVFEILAPEGHEVVGLHGRAGAVLDYVGLITQMK